MGSSFRKLHYNMPHSRTWQKPSQTETGQAVTAATLQDIRARTAKRLPDVMRLKLLQNDMAVHEGELSLAAAQGAYRCMVWSDGCYDPQHLTSTFQPRLRAKPFP